MGDAFRRALAVLTRKPPLEDELHSFQRLFVRKAAYAPDKRAHGYSGWTIAEVVGHAVENASLEGIKLPLGLTMSRYAGDASGRRNGPVWLP